MTCTVIGSRVIAKEDYNIAIELYYDMSANLYVNHNDTHPATPTQMVADDGDDECPYCYHDYVSQLVNCI